VQHRSKSRNKNSHFRVHKNHSQNLTSLNTECAVIPDTNTGWSVLERIYNGVKYELLTFAVLYLAHTLHKDGRLSLNINDHYKHNWVHTGKPGFYSSGMVCMKAVELFALKLSVLWHTDNIQYSSPTPDVKQMADKIWRPSNGTTATIPAILNLSSTNPQTSNKCHSALSCLKTTMFKSSNFSCVRTNFSSTSWKKLIRHLHHSQILHTTAHTLSLLFTCYHFHISHKSRAISVQY
jgi:hypothetical protein